MLRWPTLYLRTLTALSFPARHRHPSEWTVQLGELSAKPPFWNLWAFYHRYKVQDIFMYPYFRGFLLNDIALLRLSSSVTYNKYIKPICVLDSFDDFQNRNDCWVTGWGDIQENQGEAGDKWQVWGWETGA